MKRITSRQNPIVARFRAVSRGEDPRLLLLDGPHLIAEALSARIPVRHAMVTADGSSHRDVSDLVERIGRNGGDVASVTARVMAAVSSVRSSSVIVAIADRPVEAGGRMYDSTVPLVVVACDVQDPGNLGAIVRVAEAGGATGMVAAGHSADPFGPKALRGSMGSALRLPIAVGAPTEAVSEARRHQCRVVATVPRGGRSIFEADLTGALAILTGGEGPGLSDALASAADERVTIPMQSPVESLNTAVTAALLIYEARRQRNSHS